MKNENYIPLKTYRLPFLEVFAHHWPWVRSVLILSLSAAIIVPIMAANSWNLWYLLYFLPFLILALISLINLGRWFYYRARSDAFKAEAATTPNHAAIFGGAPGTGKSLTAVASTYEMAKEAWQQLKYEHWLLLNRMRKKGYVETERDREVREAYDFYMTHPGIPCLGSTISIYSKRLKRYCYKFEFAHLAQKKRLPYRMNAVVDEIGALTSVDGARKRQEGNIAVLKVSEHFKFCRQFTELRMIGTEQDTKNVFIDVRRVVAENRIYKTHKTVLKPLFLKWVFDKLKNFFTERGELTSIFFAKFMINFDKFIKASGFFQIKYGVSVNTETGQSADTGERGTIYLACLTEWEYDTRAYSGAYAPLNKPIEIDVFNSSGLMKEDMLGLLRSFVEEKRQAEEKRKVQEKKN